MSKFISEKLQNISILKGFAVDIREPSKALLRRHLNNSSPHLLRQINTCIYKCVEEQKNQACLRDRMCKIIGIQNLRRKLRDYSMRDSNLSSKSNGKSLTKLLQTDINTVDIMSKYNQVLAVKLHGLMMADSIESTKQTMIQWNNHERLNVLKSPNFRHMNFQLKQSHNKQKQANINSKVYRKNRSSAVINRCYSPLSTTHKSLW